MEVQPQNYNIFIFNHFGGLPATISDLKLSQRESAEGTGSLADQITSAQFRAARALLDWSMIDLAKAAQVSISTIKRVEDGRPRSAAERSSAPIQSALERAGVRFLDDDGDGPGVRLKPL